MKPTVEPRTSHHQQSVWLLVLAFFLVYTSWGTTYLAIKKGVETLPPGLFSGARLVAAGFILFLYLLYRGERLRLTLREFLLTMVAGFCLFIGGNALITVAEKTVDSGVASVLVATTPLWVAIIELLWPWGERLTHRGWLGLFTGLAGVFILMAPQLHNPAAFLEDIGPILVIASSIFWAIGSFILRHGHRSSSYVLSAAYQMCLGGSGTIIIGLAAGEADQISTASFTPAAVGSFLYLLVVGSLIGYMAYIYLLKHVSATLAGTYAYVNPAIALLVGWLIADEKITVWIIAGMLVILAGVALIRMGGMHHQRLKEASSPLPSNDGESTVPSMALTRKLASPGEVSCCRQQ